MMGNRGEVYSKAHKKERDGSNRKNTTVGMGMDGRREER
jgi:hypothetical protein